MGRHKNAQWNLPEPKLETWEQAGIALLMDLRDELQSMNQKLSVLQCHNFLRIPQKLDAIRRNTTKKKRRVA